MLKQSCITSPHHTKSLFEHPAFLFGYFYDHAARLIYCISSVRHHGFYFFFFFFLLFVLVQLLFNGGVCFIGKLADSNDSWIRYMWVIQLGLTDAGSSTRNLLVLLSAVEMSLRTQTALEIAQWAWVGIIVQHIHAPHILAAATIRGRHLFCSELPIIQLLFKSSV